MMPSETLLRWIIEGESHISRFREKERIVNQVVIPLLANGTVRELASGYLVSKRRGCQVWFMVLTNDGRVDELRAAVESHLREIPWRREQADVDDPLLDPDTVSYRQLLREVTDVALDLHGDPNLIEHQMHLIHIACGTADAAGELLDFLHQYSRTFAAFPEHHKLEFWTAFKQPSPHPKLPVPIQCFWNIVLGCEPAPGGNPAAVADLIGIT
jgi:hypothetical protein